MGSRPTGRDGDLANVQAELRRWPQLTAALAKILTDATDTDRQRAELDSALAAAMASTRPCSVPDAGQRAMSCALAGDMSAARGWLEVAACEPEPEGTARLVAASAECIARSLVATRTLQNDPIAGHFAGCDSGDARADEFSPFAAYARASHALVWGDRIDALDALCETSMRADRVAAKAGGATARPLLAAAKAELMMALGRGNNAKGVLDAEHGDHPMLRVARARLALLTGEHECAVALANALPTESGDPGSPYHRLEMMVIASVAHHRLGQEIAAADMLRRAINQTGQMGAFLPLASAPRDNLAAIAVGVPGARALLGADPIAAAPEIYPAGLALIMLTDREQAVLEKLAVGMALREIALTSFVSANTVKSQLQSLYRKLNAISRAQALASAAELHFLPSDREP